MGISLRIVRNKQQNKIIEVDVCRNEKLFNFINPVETFICSLNYIEARNWTEEIQIISFLLLFDGMHYHYFSDSYHYTFKYDIKIVNFKLMNMNKDCPYALDSEGNIILLNEKIYIAYRDYTMQTVFDDYYDNYIDMEKCYSLQIDKN